MKLDSLGPVQKTRLAGEAQSAGYAVVRDVDLPAVFEPPCSDLVFLQRRGRCEVYLDARVRYRGDDPDWQLICTGDELPGSTRLMLKVRGDLVTGLGAARALLGRAGPAGDRAPEEAGRPAAMAGEAGERPSPDAAPASGGLLRDLVELRRRQPLGLSGREELLLAVTTSLLRQSKPGVVLTGPAGVGKTTLVEMLAERIAGGDGIPEGLAGTPVYDLPLGRLLEEVRCIGDLERQVRPLIGQPGRPVFFLDEIHQLSRPELAPLCDLLKPALASGGIRVIGATTNEEWRNVRDAAFRRRFIEVAVPEPSPAGTYAMLGRRIVSLAAHHRLEMDDRLVREAIMLADRHLPMRRFPDKAIDLLDQAAAIQAARRGTVSGAGDTPAGLQRESLLQAVAAQSGLPPEFLEPDESRRLAAAIGQALNSHLRGQEPAIGRLQAAIESRLIQRHLGWQNEVEGLVRTADGRPLAALLLHGPTGTGKSVTARILADTLYGGRLIVLNGGDVGPEAPHGVSMWVGSPPGYVGSSIGGALTNGLRQHRSCVILFDEVEKAGPEAIGNVLLPLLGDGQVTDRNTGETLRVSDCLVICTSNAPPARCRFGQEILGRFNARIGFDRLDPAACRRIWDDRLKALEERLGPGSRIAMDETAEAWIDERLGQIEGGARGVADLFEAAVVPLAAGLGTGARLQVTAGRDGLTARPAGGEPCRESVPVSVPGPVA